MTTLLLTLLFTLIGPALGTFFTAHIAGKGPKDRVDWACHIVMNLVFWPATGSMALVVMLALLKESLAKRAAVAA